MRSFTLVIPGVPVGKQRPKAAVIAGHAKVYTPQKTVTFESKVSWAWHESYPMYTPTKGQVAIFIEFFFPYPKSAYWPVNKKHNGELRPEAEQMKYTKKPDIDNLVKAVLDGLNGIAFKDDAQISTLCATKRYGEKPQAIVRLLMEEE